MIYTHLIAAAVAALAAWFFQDNRYTAEMAELRLSKRPQISNFPKPPAPTKPKPH